jgi:hypothetical protein
VLLQLGGGFERRLTNLTNSLPGSSSHLVCLNTSGGSFNHQAADVPFLVVAATDRVSKCFTTAPTLVGVFHYCSSCMDQFPFLLCPCMDQLVSVLCGELVPMQSDRCCELSRTVFTLVRPFLCMEFSHVRLPVACPLEPPVAKFTLEGSLVTVLLHVRVQIAHHPESLATDITHMVFFP